LEPPRLRQQRHRGLLRRRALTPVTVIGKPTAESESLHSLANGEVEVGRLAQPHGRPGVVMRVRTSALIGRSWACSCPRWACCPRPPPSSRPSQMANCGAETSRRPRHEESNTKLTRGVPGAVATGWIGAAALGGPQARALAFSRSNSDWLIAPASSSSLARAICSVGVVSPVVATSLLPRGDVHDRPVQDHKNLPRMPTATGPELPSRPPRSRGRSTLQTHRRRPAWAASTGRSPRVDQRSADAGAWPTTGSVPAPRSSWSLRVMAALINDRWVNAWGKLPSCSPVSPISSAYSPRWLA
jgi:hypothetical protein